MICFSSFILTLFGIGLSKYSFKQDILHGRMNQSLQSRFDLAQMILVRLPKESERDKAINQPTKLMELLSTVYARKITPDVKLKKLADMGISVTDEVGERINTMCNLSEGIFEEGREKGLEEAERQRVIAEEQRSRADELQLKNDELARTAADAQAEVIRLKEQIARLKAEGKMI